jgi:peptidoglycan-associated lipoprotein
MRFTINATLALLLAIAAVSTQLAVAQGVPSTPPGKELLRAELALDYTYLRSNAPPGSCTCFNLNGGSATFAWPVKPGGFAAVADLTVDQASGIGSSGLGLRLATFTGGARYVPRIGHSPLQPFGQVSVGLAHASGTLVGKGTPGAINAGSAFAANMGGGLDVRINRRISMRVAEADYLLTTVHNDTNNHQNNLRISAGLVLHF